MPSLTTSLKVKDLVHIFFMLSGRHDFNFDVAFCSFVLFCFYFYFFIIFRLFFDIVYVYFLVPRYITTYICILGDCKFFRV